MPCPSHNGMMPWRVLNALSTTVKHRMLAQGLIRTAVLLRTHCHNAMLASAPSWQHSTHRPCHKGQQQLAVQVPVTVAEPANTNVATYLLRL